MLPVHLPYDAVGRYAVRDCGIFGHAYLLYLTLFFVSVLVRTYLDEERKLVTLL